MSPTDTVEAAAARTGWGTAPLWTIARRVDRTGFPDAELLSVYRDWGVVRKADRDDNFNVESDDLSSYKFVKRGDLVLNKMKTWQGSLGVSDFEGIVSPAYFTCELSPTVHPRFIHYLLRSDLYIAMYAAASKGIRPNQWDLPYEEFRSLEALLPPLEEQRRIADFLDDQVARIDAAIEGRKKQHELLGTYFGSRLDHLVATMPLVPLRRLMTSVTSGPRGWGDLVADSGTRMLIRINNISGSGIEPNLASVAWLTPPDDAEARRAQLEDGDLLVSITASIGDVAVAGPELRGAAFSQHVARIRPIDGGVSRALAWCASAPASRERLLNSAAGGTKIGLGLQQVSDWPVPLVPLGEEKPFTRTVEDAFKDVLAAQLMHQRSCEALSEYRRSLITAAVTGELDVTTARRGVPA